MFVSILFLPLYFLWLSVCLFLALLGCCVPRVKSVLSSEAVEKVTTICRVLHEKGKINAEQYSFESKVVAPTYDVATFCGYRWIVAPVIFVLQRSDALDSLVQFFVFWWMKVQRSRLAQGRKVLWFEALMVSLATSIAQRVGNLVFLFKIS